MASASETPPAPNPDDGELIARYRAGERRAFDELVARHEKAIFGVAVRALRDQGEAEDVTQRAFVQAFRRLDGFRGNASFRTWLYRIALNLVATHARDTQRRRRALAQLEPDALHAPADARPRAHDEASLRLRAAVEQLPPKQRLVVELRIYDELPFREVAAIVESSEDAAKMNFHHALKRLRALMSEGADA
jgi:RNA polymerase sigma-70 factor (ECF subfamily)